MCLINHILFSWSQTAFLKTSNNTTWFRKSTGSHHRTAIGWLCRTELIILIVQTSLFNYFPCSIRTQSKKRSLLKKLEMHSSLASLAAKATPWSDDFQSEVLLGLTDNLCFSHWIGRGLKRLGRGIRLGNPPITLLQWLIQKSATAEESPRSVSLLVCDDQNHLVPDTVVMRDC